MKTGTAFPMMPTKQRLELLGSPRTKYAQEGGHTRAGQSLQRAGPLRAVSAGSMPLRGPEIRGIARADDILALAR
jgi:hypothetical protein